MGTHSLCGVLARMRSWLGLALACMAAFSATAQTTAPELDETGEVLFRTSNVMVSQFDILNNLMDRSTELGSAVRIYEFVRNNYHYVPYYGSRSGSVNTFHALLGNDVDLASLMIAMFRSQGIQARYAVSDIRVGAAQLQAWLGVRNLDLAAALLNNQGIQNVSIATDRSYVQFEHVWVEVLIPHDEYRGAETRNGATCNTPTAGVTCRWVSLDPSYKQYKINAAAIDIYNAVSFDYDRYYNAIKNNDAIYRDRNPLEIFEDLALAYLRTNYPGKTLNDVIDRGEIIQDEPRLLPASLPYVVVGTPRRYASASIHDGTASEIKKWTKLLTVTVYKQVLGEDGKPVLDPAYRVGTQIYRTHLLNSARASVNSFFTTTSDGSCTATAPCVVVRFRGPQYVSPNYLYQASNIVVNPAAFNPTTDRFVIELKVDGSPSTQTGVADPVHSVLYTDIKAGQFNVFGMGGAYSNAAQGMRATELLLTAAENYPLINNAAGVPYIDANRNGVIDAGERALQEDVAATEDLTGNLLDLANRRFMAKHTAALNRLSALNQATTQIDLLWGSTSSTFDVASPGQSPFTVVPGGLLIDMKGQVNRGSWRNAVAPTSSADRIIKLYGHAVSAYEHETWQEIVGYDAISTVRGIQLAAASGATVLTLKKNASTDTLQSQYGLFGFTSVGPNYAPSPLLIRRTDLFGYRHVTWYASSGGPYGFDVFRKVDSLSNSALKRSVYTFRTDNGLDEFVVNVKSMAVTLQDGITQYGAGCFLGAPGYYFGDAYHQGACSQVLSELQAFHRAVVTSPSLSRMFTFLDENQGFVAADCVYRSNPAAANLVSSTSMAEFRSNLYAQNNAQSWSEYIVPTLLPLGETYRYSVFVRNDYSVPTGNLLTGSTYGIGNASGGYVDGRKQFTTATVVAPGVTPGVPALRNALLTDQNTIAEANNDPIRTPSSTDPISLVTGNNFHDETDFTIRGRGLDYTFTRTYNSTPASLKKETGFGWGWTHSYAMRLISNDYGNCPNCPTTGATAAPENGNGKTSSITYVDERGGEHNYLVNETSLAVSSPEGEYSQLAFDTAGGQHTLTFRNGTKYVFEGPSDLKSVPGRVARLKYIQDPYGNQLEMSYDTSGRLIKVADNLAIAGRTGITFTYAGTSRRIETISDWAGVRTRYTYKTGSDQQLETVRDRFSNILSQYAYTYTASPRLLKAITHPSLVGNPSTITIFDYLANGRAIMQANAAGQAERIEYDLFRRSTQVTDARNAVRGYDFDEAGRLVRLAQPDGSVLTFENTASGWRTKKTDGLGYATQYSYRDDKAFIGASDSLGKVTRQRDPLNRDIDTTYGLYDQPATVKDPRGVTRQSTYFSASDGTCGVRGKLQRASISQLTVRSSGADVVLANVPLQDYCYNPDGTIKKLTEYIDAQNLSRKRVTDYYYQAGTNNLNLERMVVSGSGKTIEKSYTYDERGRKKTETLKRRRSPTDGTLISLTTTWEYDDQDHITNVIDPDGNQLQTVYDTQDRITKVIGMYRRTDGGDDQRILSNRTYDVAGRLATDEDVYGRQTAYYYDDTGNLTDVVSPDGRYTGYRYDAMNRRIAVIDGNGQRTETKYNLRGDVIAVTDATGQTVQSTYDEAGQLTTQTAAKGTGYVTEYRYDAAGNRTHVIDANAKAGLAATNSYGATTYTKFDELNRPVLVVDANNGEVRTSYDLLGNTISITDQELQTTRMVFNDLGQLTEEVDPRTETPTDKTRKTQVDEAGNVYERTNRLGQVTRYTYDNLNRLTRVDYVTDATSDQIGYDRFGNVERLASGDVTYSMTYDNKNRIKTRTDSRGRSMSFDYDDDNNVVRKVDYQGEETLFTWDGANRLVSERNPAYLEATYQYDAAGRVLTRSLSTGARTEYSYDADGWPTGMRQVSANGTTIGSWTYGRDRVGNLKTLNDLTGTSSFGYDPLNRLTSSDVPGTANDELFTYDKVGNRKTAARGGVTKYYEYFAGGGNRLRYIRQSSATGAIERCFEYDDEGRTTFYKTGSTCAQTTHQFAWNQAGRMSTATMGSTVLRSRYDAAGFRVGTSGGRLGTVNHFLSNEHLEATYDATGLSAKYMRGAAIDEVVVGYVREGSKLMPYVFHHDKLTSVVALTGPNGETRQTVSYSPFGEQRSESATTSNRMRYTGREADADTGLYQYRRRFYDPMLGRFLSEDPKQFGAGINFYTYVLNNPLNANDPSGLQAMMYQDASNPDLRWINFYNVSFTGPADSPEARNRWINETQDRMTGAFGSRYVFSTVFTAPGNVPVPGGIVVNFQPGRTVVDARGEVSNAYTEWDVYGSGTKTVTIPAKPPSWTTIPHENFHLLCFSCKWPGGHNEPGTSIMNSGPSSSRSITQDLFDIVERAQSPLPVFRPGTNISLSSGLSWGGYVIYPNMINDAMTRSVYSK